jgi:4'-phosphopantetheinyl transferase EntD
MPLENLHTYSNAAWALWKIEEDEGTLTAAVAPYEPTPPQVSNVFKRLEFLAARVLIQALLSSRGLKFHGLTKDAFGKPYLRNHDLHVSLSHSYPYVAAVLHDKHDVGIDLEQPKPKLLKIAHRVLHPDELANAGSDIVKHCIYWCAKEALVKIHGKKDLTFSENLKIDSFSRAKQGDLIGRIIVNTKETEIPLQYFDYDNFVVVLNK